MRKSLQKYRLKGAAALGAIALVMAGCASTENGNGNGEGDDTVYTLSYATNVGQGDHGSVANQAWMDLVTERTDGRVQFEAFWQEALCKTPELLDCTRDGRADITPVSPSFDPSAFPLAGVVTIPYVTENVIATAKSLTQLYREVPEVKAEYNAVNVHILHAIPTTSTVMGTREFVDGLDDIRGKTIRGGGLLLNALDMVGVNAIAIAIGEVYESLDRGVIDGWFSTTLDNSVLDFKLNEVTPYIADTGAGSYQAGAVIMNLDRWNSLPEDIQKIMTDTSDEIMSSYGEEFLFPLYDRVCDAVEAEGVTISIWPDEAKDEWRNLVEKELRVTWEEGAAKVVPDVDAFFSSYVDMVRANEAAGDVPTAITYCLSK